MARPSVLALLAFAVVGCQANTVPVPVMGSVDQLVGEWSGEYYSPDTRRHGSILFHLDPGRDSATGDVLMIPDGGRAMPSVPERIDDQWRTWSQVVQISFVRCSDGEVTGWMVPYPDPETGELTYTEFTGHLDGDTLKGTFVSRVDKIGRRAEGTWSVVRKK